MVGFHFAQLFVLLVPCALGWIIPLVLGFAYVMPDANRRGQPGLLWALITIPLGWLAILGYLIMRAITTPAARG